MSTASLCGDSCWSEVLVLLTSGWGIATTEPGAALSRGGADTTDPGEEVAARVMEAWATGDTDVRHVSSQAPWY